MKTKQLTGGKEMKRKTAVLAILVLGFSFMCAGFVEAATDTASVTLSATVSSMATLTLGTSTVTFANANPTTTANVQATEQNIAVTASVRTASSPVGTATLYVLAADDLKSGTDVIPITAVTSTAANTSGTFFAAGPVTWSKSSQGALVGSGNSGYFTGTFNWFLANSWTYPTGSYGTTAIYTLTAP
jgi:hypothetical protein